jgi:hypothetical protein
MIKIPVYMNSECIDLMFVQDKYGYFRMSNEFSEWTETSLQGFWFFTSPNENDNDFKRFMFYFQKSSDAAIFKLSWYVNERTYSL